MYQHRSHALWTAGFFFLCSSYFIVSIAYGFVYSVVYSPNNTLSLWETFASVWRTSLLMLCCRCVPSRRSRPLRRNGRCLCHVCDQHCLGNCFVFLFTHRLAYYDVPLLAYSLRHTVSSMWLNFYSEKKKDAEERRIHQRRLRQLLARQQQQEALAARAAAAAAAAQSDRSGLSRNVLLLRPQLQNQRARMHPRGYLKLHRDDI